MLYMVCVVNKLLNEDSDKVEVEFDKILENISIRNWSSSPIELWLEKADIPDDARQFIQEKTELMKKYQK